MVHERSVNPLIYRLQRGKTEYGGPCIRVWEQLEISQQCRPAIANSADARWREPY